MVLETETIGELLDSLPQVGRLEWIGLSPARKAPIQVVQEARVEVGTGLAGDRHSRSGKGSRQVTLVQAEHLPVIAALTGRAGVGPQDLRRNLVVSGINLWALHNRRFRVGEVLLEGTGDCAPCSFIEKSLGPGGYNAARGHAGITARVLEAGGIRVGDPVRLEPGGGEATGG